MTTATISSQLGRREQLFTGEYLCPRIGEWKLKHLLAQGRNTEVFLVSPVAADEPSVPDYALKHLKPEYATQSAEVERFRREAAVGHRFVHSHLVPVLMAAVDQSPFYFVMPFLRGSTVRQSLDLSGPFVPPHSLWIVRQLADALSVFHRAGWRHGDIQPGNVLIDARGHTTLLDFGCAFPCHRGSDLDQQLLTGHLHYVAPEQLVRWGSACAASDVYSLGIVLFEMLTGRRPFPDTDPARLAEHHLRTVPPSVRTYRPDLPRELARGIERMLAKDPGRRPATDGELQAFLTRMEIETFELR